MAEQGHDPSAAAAGGFGGGGMPGGSFHFGGGMPHGTQTHMSSADAEAFFEHFFGGSDPFGGMGGSFGAGGPSSRMRMRHGSGGFGGGDPFGGMMFGGDPFGGSMGGGGGMRSSFGGMPQQRVRTRRYDAIPNGTVVSLKGLVSRPERNGDRGEVVGYDPSSGRYTIEIEDSDERISVKPSNLLQHVHVHLENLQSQSHLNGSRGTIIAYNDHKHRYNIYVMDLAKVVSLKPENCILEDGTVAKIVNLQSKPQLNGKYGTIKSWIKDVNRYDVQLSPDQIIRVKAENVRV